MDEPWTVGELIDELSEYDRNKKVVLYNKNYGEDHPFVLDDLNEDDVLRLEF